MITNCPHCGQKVRTEKPGKYRCPSCHDLFEINQADFSPDQLQPEQDLDTFFSSDTIDNETDPNTEADLYIDQEEIASSCETCGRPGAESICKLCGAFVCSTCVHRHDEQGICPVCVDKLEKTDTGSYGGATSLSPPSFLSSFFPKLKKILLEPSGFFSEPMPKEPSHYPYLFALICYVIGKAFESAYVAMNLGAIFESFDDLTGGLVNSMPEVQALVENPGMFFTVRVLMSPIAFVFQFLIMSLVIHLFITMLGKPRKGLSGTMLVVAYSYAAYLLLIIPTLGGLISFVWNIIIIVIGTSRIHSMTPGRTAAATLLPLVLILILAFLLISMFVALFQNLLPI